MENLKLTCTTQAYIISKLIQNIVIGNKASQENEEVTQTEISDNDTFEMMDALRTSETSVNL